MTKEREVYKVVREHRGEFISAIIDADQRLEGHTEDLQCRYTMGKTTRALPFTAGVTVFGDLEDAQRFIADHIFRHPHIMTGTAKVFSAAEDARRRAWMGYAADMRGLLPIITPEVAVRLPEGTLLAESFTPTKVLPKEDLPIPYRLVEEED